MKTSQIVVMAVVLLAAGFAGGIVVRTLGADHELQTVQRDLRSVKERETALEAELAKARAEAARLQERYALLQEELAYAGPVPQTGFPDITGFAESSTEADADEAPGGATDTEQDPRRRFRRNDWDEGRRREAMEEMQNRFVLMMDEEWMETDDPATKQRISEMVAYQQEMRELMQAMRTAETDEARDAVLDGMRTAREGMESVARTQQTEMLRDLARSNGIEDSAQQTEFIDQVRDVLRDPLFRMGGMPGPGGRGPWRGRPGGRDRPGGNN